MSSTESTEKPGQRFSVSLIWHIMAAVLSLVIPAWDEGREVQDSVQPSSQWSDFDLFGTQKCWNDLPGLTAAFMAD